MAYSTSDRDKPLFMISVVAEMLDIHPQTLRLYEREGLVVPQRTGGNTRLYSQEDIDTLRRILRLTRELGVNLAGVEVILSMRERMEQMQEALEQLVQYAQQLEQQVQTTCRDAQPSSSALVKVSKRGIVIRHDNF
ncbi:MerR family transcriptional regulator [candidate division KSB3 bacterium]|uniref:MerR family transcriptional regulator n=1 Tax=candidate division KSB3 bacterium TaxID=2044937 RepID=A0A2G6E642_9BACT|nr:MAG: MerR family transcriptional regulator [candidate division KSB3 bacterium]PIE30043.1 MAG: MerR family transcriptional regulator [candidate division KSB3 bacterium]